MRIARKIESYHVTHNGVKPLNPLQGANTRDPSIETPPFRAGRGHIVIFDPNIEKIVKPEILESGQDFFFQEIALDL
mgnify:CR=1 FL=1